MKKIVKQLIFSLMGTGVLFTLIAVGQYAYATSTIIVTPDSPNGWGFFQETPTGSGTFVYGPSAPPLGGGSAQITVNATGGEIFGTFAFAGTRLDAITSLAYSTYRVSGSAALATSLQLDIDTNSTDTSTAWQGRLVYEPYYTHTVSTGIWQTWNPLDNAATGNWWFSGTPGNAACPMNNACTWAEVLAAFPNAAIRFAGANTGAVQFKAGSGWSSSFVGNVDAFAIGINNVVTAYDFELPYTIPTIVSISPSSKSTGDAAFTLTVNGTNFFPASVVQFNGSNRATAFVSSTQLTANILLADLVSAGNFPITVMNPTPGGGTSNALMLTETAPTSPDVSAPTIPGGLSATVISPSRIDFSWASSTDNVGVIGYKVFRNAALVTTTTDIFYHNSNLVPSTTYSYSVAAYDAAGNTSAQSAAVSALTGSLVPDSFYRTGWVDHGVDYTAPAGGDAYYPSVVFDANGFGEGVAKFKMWYSDGLGATFLVTSTDGATWGLPATMTGLANAHHTQVLYDNNCFKRLPCVVATPKYRMYYWDMGANLYSLLAMASAESADGIHWTKRAALVQNPAAKLVQDPDSGTGWNRGTYGPVNRFYQPKAINVGTDPWDYSFVMYYNGTDGNHEYTGLAYSADGSYWNAYPGNPVLSGSLTGGSQGWDCVSAVYGTVFKDYSLGYHYFYSGSGQDNGSGGCAPSASFTGIGAASSVDGKTWTKDANPIFSINDGVPYRSGRIYTPTVVDDGSGILRMYFSARDAAGGPKKIGYATLVKPSTPQTAILHVIMLVVNSTTGEAVAHDFVVHVKGSSGQDITGNPSVTLQGLKTVSIESPTARIAAQQESPQFGISAPGTAYSVGAGTYNISVEGNGAYIQSFSGACDTSGNVTLASGDNKICTIVSTDIPLPVVTAIPVSGWGGGGENRTPVTVPLIGFLKVPRPLVLPAGPGLVTYDFTVWNIGKQTALTNVTIADNKCAPGALLSGDTNSNSKLDANEIWKYNCSTRLSTTTVNIAVVTGYSDDSYHQAAIATAMATVVVGVPVVPGLPNTGLVPPLITILSVPNRLTPLPLGGGDVTFTYTVTNPGIAPVQDVAVTDDKCSPVVRSSGDANGNGLLDPDEIWVYTCRTNVSISVRDIAMVKGTANGLAILGYAFATVLVEVPTGSTAPTITPALGLQIKNIATNLAFGSKSDTIKILQQFLITQDGGQKLKALAKVGATGYFGTLTRAALAEFQAKVGIKPAWGNFGRITRNYIKSHF